MGALCQRISQPRSSFSSCRCSGTTASQCVCVHGEVGKGTGGGIPQSVAHSASIAPITAIPTSLQPPPSLQFLLFDNPDGVTPSCAGNTVVGILRDFVVPVQSSQRFMRFFYLLGWNVNNMKSANFTTSCATGIDVLVLQECFDESIVPLFVRVPRFVSHPHLHHHRTVQDNILFACHVRPAVGANY